MPYGRRPPPGAAADQPGRCGPDSAPGFQTAIYRSSHNDVLINTLDSLWDKADRYRRLGLEVIRSKVERDQKAAEHTALVHCVSAGDTEGAATVMRQHIATSLGAKVVFRLGARSTPSSPSVRS